VTAVARVPAMKAQRKPYVPCPTPNGFTGASCKRRGCPICGASWARSVGAVTEKNLAHLDGAVVMIAVTPPGAKDLPFDCNKVHRRRGTVVPCASKFGCRTEDAAAESWARSAPERWKKLRDAARKAVARADFPTAGLVVQRFWEPQKRGVPHLHLISVARTPIEYAAANRFAIELSRLAPEYGFGFVDRGRRQPSDACPVRNHRDGGQLRSCTCAYALPRIDAAEARRYLVSYLTGRQPHKSSIRENISHPRMPRSLWWLTPALSSFSTKERIEGMRERLGVRGGTGVTMRRLRYVRWYLAALAGRCSVYPRLMGDDRLEVARVALLLEPKKARAPGETDELALRRHMKNLRTMRLLQPEWSSARQTGQARKRREEYVPVPQAPVQLDPYMQMVLDVHGARRHYAAVAA